MANEFLVQKAVKKRGKQVLALLKTELSYTVINEQIKQKVKFMKTRNFINSPYSESGKYRFPYSYTSSSNILEWEQFFYDIYDLIVNVYFKDELNTYAST